jgi:nitrogen fixation protein FixH
MPVNNNHQPARKGSWRWPVIIIGLLAGHVTLMMTAVVIISQRPGESAVIPNYYEKEQSYDGYKAALAASKALGWNADLQQSDQTDAIGCPQMHLKLVDSAGKPLAGAQLSVHCFHWSHGNEAAVVSTTSRVPGQYDFTLPHHYQGFWQFDLTANKGSDSFIQTISLFIQ